MKSKRLIGFLVVLIFLTVLIVLNSTLFTLQKISVNWLTTKYNLQGVKDYVMVDCIETGDSIFLLKKKEIVSTLEKKYPYLQVVSIETKFPNQIVIHSAERECLYAIYLSDTEYVLVDEKGKVLNFANSSIFAGSELKAKPIKVSFNSISRNPEQFSVGEYVKNEDIVNLLSQISLTFRESGYVPTTSKGVFVSIDVTSMGQDGVEVYFKVKNGMTIAIKDALNLTTEKFLLGLSVYNKHHQDGVVEGCIEVWHNNLDDKVTATYIENWNL